jgi:hypothetical protein
MIDIREHGGSFGGGSKKPFKGVEYMTKNEEFMASGVILYKNKDKNEFFIGTDTQILFMVGSVTVASYTITIPSTQSFVAHYEPSLNISYFIWTDTANGNTFKCLYFNHNTNVFGIQSLHANNSSASTFFEDGIIYHIHTTGSNKVLTKYNFTSSGLSIIQTVTDTVYNGYNIMGCTISDTEIFIQTKGSGSWGYTIIFRKSDLVKVDACYQDNVNITWSNNSMKAVAIGRTLYVNNAYQVFVYSLVGSNNVTVVTSRNFPYISSYTVWVLYDPDTQKLYYYSTVSPGGGGVNEDAYAKMTLGVNKDVYDITTKVWEIDPNTLATIGSDPVAFADFYAQIYQPLMNNFYQTNRKGILGFAMIYQNQIKNPAYSTLHYYKKVL